MTGMNLAPIHEDDLVMLYVGAVVGEDCWLRPDQVARMSDLQAAMADDRDRRQRLRALMRSAAGDVDGRWYAANTREPIRDETLRECLVRLGAVRERAGLATTLPLPKYAMAPEFVALFHSSLRGDS